MTTRTRRRRGARSAAEPRRGRGAPGRAGGGEAGARLSHAEVDEQPAVLLRRRIERLEHGRVARSLAGQRVFARGEPGAWVKEEQPFGERRDATPAQIGALDMDELV